MIRKQINTRLLFISSHIPPTYAGSGRNTYNFSKYLVKQGVAVSILSFNRKCQFKFKKEIDGIKIIRLFYLNLNYLTKLISLIIILPGYFFYILNNDVVFIYGGNIIAFEMIILFSKILNKKIVFRSTMYNEDDIQSLVNHNILGVFRKSLLNKINIYFSINNSFTKSWLKVYGDNKKLFYHIHGVDINEFYPITHKNKINIRKILNLPENTFIIISIGYLVYRKGFDKIFKILAELDFPFLYIVLGDYHLSNKHYLNKYNSEMTELFIQGKQLLENKIYFAGPKDNVSQWLKASDIFILYSKQEGFPPNSLMEAMACGIPVIFKKDVHFKTNNDEFDKSILFVKNNSELSQTIKHLYYNKEERKLIGRNAYKAIKKFGSFDVLWRNIIEALEL